MATAPVVCLATWALFGIQEIGLLIEDPFQVGNPLLSYTLIRSILRPRRFSYAPALFLRTSTS